MGYANGYFSRLNGPRLLVISGGIEPFTHRFIVCIALKKRGLQFQSAELSTDAKQVVARFVRETPIRSSTNIAARKYQIDLKESLIKPPDTVGQPPSAEICVSNMPALKAKKLRKLLQEKVLIEL